jgi:hypothetical protein
MRNLRIDRVAVTCYLDIYLEGMAKTALPFPAGAFLGLQSTCFVRLLTMLS